MFWVPTITGGRCESFSCIVHLIKGINLCLFAPAIGHGFNKDLKAPGETWRVCGDLGAALLLFSTASGCFPSALLLLPSCALCFFSSPFFNLTDKSPVSTSSTGQQSFGVAEQLPECVQNGGCEISPFKV